MNTSFFTSQPVRVSLIIFAFAATILGTGLVARDVLAQSQPLVGGPGCPIVYQESPEDRQSRPSQDEYEELRDAYFGYVVMVYFDGVANDSMYSSPTFQQAFQCPSTVEEFKETLEVPPEYFDGWDF